MIAIAVVVIIIAAACVYFLGGSSDLNGDEDDGQELAGYVMPGSTISYTYQVQYGEQEDSTAWSWTVVGFHDGEYLYQGGPYGGEDIDSMDVNELKELSTGEPETGTVDIPGVGTTGYETYSFVEEDDSYSQTVSYTLVFGGLLYRAEVAYVYDVSGTEYSYVISLTMTEADLTLGEYGEVDEDPIVFGTSEDAYYDTVTVSRISESVDGYYLYMVNYRDTFYTGDLYIGDSDRIPAYAEDGATSVETYNATIYFDGDGLTGVYMHGVMYDEEYDGTAVA